MLEYCPGNPFTFAAPQYAKVRPSYPQAVLDEILTRLCPLVVPMSALRAADIGAGTGKMSVLLAQRGVEVDAVEPSASMREQMCHQMRNVVASVNERIRITEGSAEATGLATSSCDLVVYAQSWHWVDAEAAGTEAARILREGGLLAAVWNQLDVSVPRVHRLSRIMRSGDVHRAHTPPAFGQFFEEPLLKLVEWSEVMTPEEILLLGTTRSSYLRQDGAGRERMQKNLRWYLYEHLGYKPAEEVTLPYMTLTWTARLLTS